MKLIRQFGSMAFVLGIFTALFVGMPWYIIVSDDPVIPWWLRTAIFCMLGGILLVLVTVALDLKKNKLSNEILASAEAEPKLLLQNSEVVPGRKITEVLGLVQGHTVYAIWLGKDLSALARLVLGGELTEYTEMMGKARRVATHKMIGEAETMGADGIINVRYMTTSVVGSAAELLVYGTAVKFG
jgi:uncharacterized protein YbjQ (UPF0145 family)